MPDLPEFTATAAPDGLSFTMARGEWHHRAPVADLLAWLRLYQTLHDRGAPAPAKGKAPTSAGPWAPYYAQPITALRRLQAEFKGKS